MVEVVDSLGACRPHVQVHVERDGEALGPARSRVAFSDSHGRCQFGQLDVGRYRVWCSIAGVECEATLEIGDSQAAFLRLTARSGD